MFHTAFTPELAPDWGPTPCAETRVTPTRIAPGPIMTKRRRRSPERIIRKLAEGQKLLAGGKTVEEVCREFGIAESTWARWLNQYGGMKAEDAKRLKELETENAQLKKLLAEAELDKAMLEHLAEERW